MRLSVDRAALWCGLLVVAGCGAEERGPTGAKVAIKIPPMSMPGVVGVEYALAVFNADPTPYAGVFDENGTVVGSLGNIVWEQASLTSEQYGNAGGGEISYVGSCDASSPYNWVALVLKQIDVGPNNGSWDGDGPFADADKDTLDDQNTAFTLLPGSNDGVPDFTNPSPYDAPLVLKFPCSEGDDTEVTFNITEIRAAAQGFFDIAVNFEHIYCSMKVDTMYDDGRAIKLLYDLDDPEDNGSRIETAIIGAACSAGTDGGATVMWMSALQVECDGGISFTIDPTGGATTSVAGAPGNQCVEVQTGFPQPATAAQGGFTFLNIGSPTFAAGTVCQRYENSQVQGVSYTLFGAPSSAFQPATANETGPAGNQDNVTAQWLCTGPNGTSPPICGGNSCLYNATASFGGGADVSGQDEFSDICYALYWGEENIPCGPGGSCRKEFWNIAINIDDLEDAGLESCAVTGAITASSTTDGPQFVDGQLPGPAQVYGYIAIDAPLTDADGQTTCIQGPMGSIYAPIRYGTSPDVGGGEPFPQLCYDYVQGTAPMSLGIPAPLCPGD